MGVSNGAESDLGLRLDVVAEVFAEARVEIREMTRQLSEIVASLEAAAAG